MAYPQGINFRSSLAYVTDGANNSMENANNAAGTSYPRTTAQGNTVGWESPGPGNVRDRSSAVDARLAGVNFMGVGNFNFRFDLPAAGSYNVRLAAGDATQSVDANWDLYDSGSLLGNLSTGTSGAAGNFRDASNTVRTAAAWPGSNTAVPFTFITAICRFKAGTGAGSLNNIAHAYVEAAAGGGAVLAGSTTCASVAVATLTTGIALSGSATSTTASSGTLVTPAAALAGTATCITSATGALSTGIPLAGSARANTVTLGALTTAVNMTGSSSSTATASGAVITSIALSGTAVSAATGTGALTTAIVLAGSATASATASGALTAPGSGLAGTATCSASAFGALTTSIALAGSAASTAATGGALTAPGAGLSGVATCTATATGSLTTGIALVAASGTKVFASGALTTAIRLAGAANCGSSAAGTMSQLGDTPPAIPHIYRGPGEIRIIRAAADRRVYIERI
jgi:hypothetical protein